MATPMYPELDGDNKKNICHYGEDTVVIENDDNKILFSVWDDIKSITYTLYDVMTEKRIQRWLVRLIVYPGIAVGAAVLVMNLHNIPKVPGTNTCV